MQNYFFSLYFINKMRQWQRIWDTEGGKKAPKAPTAWHFGENVALTVRNSINGTFQNLLLLNLKFQSRDLRVELLSRPYKREFPENACQ